MHDVRSRSINLPEGQKKEREGSLKEKENKKGNDCPRM